MMILLSGNLFSLPLLVYGQSMSNMNMNQPASDQNTRMENMSMITFAEIHQSATILDYKIQLTLGPPAQMLSMDEAKTAKSGEVMVNGQMASMNMSGTPSSYHLEVHVFDLKTGAVVTEKNVIIQIKDEMNNMMQDMPVSKMYDVAVGPSDMHFGNNISFRPGNYTITVTVAGEAASFPIAIHSAVPEFTAAMFVLATGVIGTLIFTTRKWNVSWFFLK
jgi:hypothetical protein